MKHIPLFVLLATLFISCSDDSGEEQSPTQGDSFDREVMLTDWADSYILPSLSNYETSINALHKATNTLIDEPTATHLNKVKSFFELAYKMYQSVEMLDIGKAEEVDFSSFSNTYPTDADAIGDRISSGEYNLSLPSSRNEQGFPAIDYLLYGYTDDVVSEVKSNEEYGNYLLAVIEQLKELATVIHEDWNNGYREQFISNSGSSANASVDRFVNDYINYYERKLRAGKLGIPAGIFSDQPRPNDAEAYYSSALSRDLALEATDAFRAFFEGYYEMQSFTSLQSYLISIGEEELADDILKQITTARNRAEQLNADIATQVELDNTEVLKTYDEYQKVVPLLKVDMMQALNISIDYVDTDGD